MADVRMLMATAEEALGALDLAALDSLSDGELDGFITAPVSYTHLTLPTNREV